MRYEIRGGVIQHKNNMIVQRRRFGNNKKNCTCSCLTEQSVTFHIRQTVNQWDTRSLLPEISSLMKYKHPSVSVDYGCALVGLLLGFLFLEHRPSAMTWKPDVGMSVSPTHVADKDGWESVHVALGLPLLALQFSSLMQKKKRSVGIYERLTLESAR